MVFSTPIFLFYFLPIVLLCYYVLSFLLRAAGGSLGGVSFGRNAFLLLASYVFYGWWNPWFIVLMFTVTALNYCCALVVVRPGASARLRFWSMTLAIVLSLATLGFFKYFMFFGNQPEPRFQLGSAVRSACWRSCSHGDFLLHFPCLELQHRRIPWDRTARPVVRGLRLFNCSLSAVGRGADHPLQHGGRTTREPIPHLGQVLVGHSVSWRSGFSKKIFCSPIRWGRLPTQPSMPGHLRPSMRGSSVLAYAFQIYFDFSGYSDMAVGLGRMIGFEFPKNFDSPYRAEHYRLLAKVAHFAEYIPARLPLHPPWGQQEGPAGRTFI